MATKKTIFETILEAYPELVGQERIFFRTIVIRDDIDGIGEYLEKWEYDKPIPEGLTVGKPE